VTGVGCWLVLVSGCYGLIIPMAEFTSQKDLAAALVVYTALVTAVAAMHITTRYEGHLMLSRSQLVHGCAPAAMQLLSRKRRGQQRA
jgi:hypothetical protein